MLDLIDFKDRVVPMAQDAAFVDVSRKYQRVSAEEALNKRPVLPYQDKAEQSELDNGYSSREIESDEGSASKKDE